MSDNLPGPSKGESARKTYPVSEAAAFLGVSAETLRRWDRKGIFKPFRTKGGQRRYSRASLEAYKSGERPAKTLLTISQAAQQLGVHPETLRRWERSGAVRVERTSGGQRRYTKEYLEKLFSKTELPVLIKPGEPVEKPQPEPLPEIPEKVPVRIAESYKPTHIGHLRFMKNVAVLSLAFGLAVMFWLDVVPGLTKERLKRLSAPSSENPIVDVNDVMEYKPVGNIMASLKFKFPLELSGLVTETLAVLGDSVLNTTRFLGTAFFGQGDRYYVNPQGDGALRNLSVEDGLLVSKIETDLVEADKVKTVRLETQSISATTGSISNLTSQSITTNSITTNNATIEEANITRLNVQETSIAGTASETFTLDTNNTGGDLSLIFGAANGESLTWDAGALQFTVSDDLSVDGGVGQLSAGTGVFSTSVTSPLYTGVGAVTVRSGGAGPLTLDSASGAISFSNDNLQDIGSVTAGGGVTLTGAGVGMDFSGAGNHLIQSSGGTLQLGAYTLTGAVTGNNQNITGLNNLTGATATFSASVASPTFWNDGDINVDARNAAADSTVFILNSDPGFAASLDVEGDITAGGSIGGGDATFSSLTVLGNSDLRGNVFNSTGFLTLADTVDITENLNFTSATPVIDATNGAATLGINTVTNRPVTFGTGLVTANNFASSGAVITGGSINNTPIGAATPSTGAFTTLASSGVTTLGDGTATVAVNSSDWVIDISGSMTGISGISNDEGYTQTGAAANTFSGAAFFTAAGTALTVNNDALVSGDLTAGRVLTSEVENPGNITLDAVNALANSTVFILNSDPTFSAGLNVEGGTTVGGDLTVLGSGTHSFAGTLDPTNVAAFTLAGDITGSGSPDITGIGQFSGNSFTDGTLTISGGNITGGLTANFATKVVTPEIENTGNLTLDAINAAADSTIFLLNSNATYQANLDVEGDITAGGGVSGGAASFSSLVVTGTSDLRGTVSDSLGNLQLADTVEVSENLLLTSATPVIDATNGAATLGINTVTNRPVTFGTGLVTANNFASSGAVITGGSINSTPIGAVTPSTGAFTTLSANADVDFLFAGSENLAISSSVSGTTAADAASISFTNTTTSGTQRMLVLQNSGTGATEAGLLVSNTGLGTNAIEITGTWGTGIVTSNNTINAGSGSIISGAITASGMLSVTSGGASITGGVSIDGDLSFVGPQTINTTTGNLTIDTAGTLVVSDAVDLNNILDLDVSSASALTVGDGVANTFTVDTATDAVTAAGAFYQTGGSPATFSGNVTFGDVSTDTITFTGRQASHLIPEVTNTYDLGSPTNKYANIYAVNLVVESTSAEGTTSNSFIINSDNATADLQDSQLEFSRGTVSPNAIIMWDSANDEFDFNFPANITSTAAAQLKLSYNSSNYMTAQVGGAGATVFDAVGAGAGFSFSDATTISSGDLTVSTGQLVASAGGASITGGLGTDSLTVSGTATFNGISTFNTDVNYTLAETENIAISNTVSGTASVDLISAALSNNTTSGTQRGLALTFNGSGVTDVGVILTYAGTGSGTTAFEIAGDWGTGILTNDNTINAGSGSITGGTGTFSELNLSGPLTITSATAPQLSVRYDASNRWDASVSVSGAVSFDAAGSGAGFSFADALAAQASLTANSTLTVGNRSGTDTATLQALGTATAITTTYDSNNLQFIGSYWDGFAAQDINAGVFLDVTGTTPTYGLALQTAGQTRAFIDQQGFVGVGDTSPVAHLVVGSDAGATYANGLGDVYVQNDLEVDGTVYGGSFSLPGLTQGSVIFAGAGGQLAQDNPNFFWDDTLNRLGIGNSSPGYPLEVTGTARVTSSLYFGTLGAYLSTDQGGSLELGPANDPGGQNPYIDFHYGIGSAQNWNYRIVNSGNNILEFKESGGGTSFVINTGDVGIGVGSTPGQKLQVAGNVAVSNNSAFMARNAGNSAWYELAKLDTSDIARYGNSTLNIELTTGEVGIGLTTPTGKLQVAGDEVRIGNAGTVNYAAGDGDLYVENILEVDGASYLSGISAGATSLAGNLTLLKTGTATAVTQYPSYDAIFQGSGWNTTTLAPVDLTGRLRTIAGSGATGAIPYRLGIFDNTPTEFVSFDLLNQRVGIGTTGPRNGLELAKLDSNYITSLRVGGILQGNSGAGIGAETSRHQILFSSWRDSYPDTVGAKVVAINTNQYSTALVQYTDLAFYTLGSWPEGADSTTEKMRITNAGNVGIGTTAPTYKFEVSGAAGAGGVARIGSMDYGSTQVLSVAPGTVNFDAPGIAGGRMTILGSNGYVGIGTTSPGAKLTVQSPTGENAEIRILTTDSSVTDVSTITFSAAADQNNARISYDFSDAKMNFRVGDVADVMTITAGNVGIGTVTPDGVLDVYKAGQSATKLVIKSDQRSDYLTTGGALGSIEFGTDGPGAGVAKVDAIRSMARSGNYDLAFLTYNAGLQEYMTIKGGTGNVGIGTTSPIGKLEISSTMNATPTTGSLVLSHPTNYQRNSIVFPSRINYTSDYGFIEYRDDDNDSGEAAQLTIGTSNDTDDDVVIDPSGRLTIAATNITLDTSGNLSVGSGTITSGLINGQTISSAANFTGSVNAVSWADTVLVTNLNADLLDDWNLTTAATGNTVMGRDASGDTNVRYLFSSYLNMSHGISGATADTIFYSSTDDYIRKNNATGMRASLGLSAGGGGDIWVEKAGDTMTGNLTMSGNAYTLYGPNSSWGAYLQVGGNGRQYVDQALYPSVAATDGNLHIDAGSGKQLYLNYYDGSNIYFGNGANGTSANVSAAGAYTGTSLNVGSGTITSGLINGQTISSAANFTGTVTATQFNGSGAGLSSATVPIASLVAGDYSGKVTSGLYSINISGNAATADKTNSFATLDTHVGTGMRPFYNWGGSNCTGSAPSAGCYTTGIQVGSHPGDQGYGFQLAQNLWDTDLYVRNYVWGYGSWYKLLSSGNYGAYSAFSGAISGTSLNVGSGAITSGLINGQTISSAANFTGTLNAASTITAPALNITGTTITVGSSAYSYVAMRDDESPNGIKYIHANSNYIGFLSGEGGWINRTDNAGNLWVAGTITSGLINGQTISSAANFTGTLNVAGITKLGGVGLSDRKLDVSNASDGITFGQDTDNSQTIQAYIDSAWTNRATYAGGCCNLLKLQPDVGDVRLGSNFNVSYAGLVTGGTYNGQTISSAANFTGTLNAASTITAPTFSGALSGNATTATQLNSYGQSDIHTTSGSMYYSQAYNATNRPYDAHWRWLYMPYDGNNNWATVLAFDFYSDRVWFQRQYGADWQTWREFIHSGNIASQTVSNSDMTDGYHLNQAVTSGANPQWGTTYANNWFRSQGATGWYNQDYGGGIWMDQADYVRVYNGKGFTVPGNVGIGTATPDGRLHVVGPWSATPSPWGTSAFKFEGSTSNHAIMEIKAPSSSQVSQLEFTNATNNLGWSISARHSVDAPNNRLQFYYYNGTSWTAPVTFDPSGNVGIGKFPDSNVRLDVLGVNDGRAARFHTSILSASYSQFIISTDETSSGDNFIALASDWDGIMDPEFRVNTTGQAFADGGWQGAADYAEYFETNDTNLEKGELVTLDPNNRSFIKRAGVEQKHALVGVISTDPGFVGMRVDDVTEDAEKLRNNPRWKIVGLLGQVPTLVSTENGPIAIGDPITISSTPGAGMKAKTAGMVVGKALEPFSGSGVGKIIVLVNPGWWDPDVYLTSAGDLQIAGSEDPVAGSAEFALKDKDGILISRVGAFSEAAIAKVKAGLVEAKELAVEGFARITGDLEVSGKLVSPVIEVESLKAGSIESGSISTTILEADTIKANRIEGVEFEQVTNITEVTNVEQTVVVSEDSGAVARFINQISDSIQTALLKAGDIVATGKIVSPVVEADTVKAREGWFDKLTVVVEAIFDHVKAQTLDVAGKITAKTAEIAEATIGKLTAVFVKADQVEAGKVTVDEVAVTDKTSGRAVLLAGESELKVTNELITAASKVFVTFRDSYAPATNYWVSDVIAGESFTVTLDQPVSADSRFDYWIVN